MKKEIIYEIKEFVRNGMKGWGEVAVVIRHFGNGVFKRVKRDK